MKDAHLTSERLRQLVHYCPETGAFTRLAQSNPNNKGWTKTGPIVGTNENGYRRFRLAGRAYKAHRVAWLYMTGSWPKGHIDHIDGDRANNRWVNLRDASRAVNAQNQRKPHSNNKLGVLGVCASRFGRYVAGLRANGKTVHVGTFDTPEEAQSAYIQAKRELHAGTTL